MARIFRCCHFGAIPGAKKARLLIIKALMKARIIRLRGDLAVSSAMGRELIGSGIDAGT